MSQLWKPFDMALELIEGINLWSVTIQTEESLQLNRAPEEAFLLQAVEMLIVGKVED